MAGLGFRYADLLKTDQLLAQRAIGAVFRGFDEAEITFCPTYKYDIGTDHFDSSPKARLPAWTDRILFYSPDGSGVRFVGDYCAHPEIRISDHKPVSGHFAVKLCNDSDPPRNRPGILQPLAKGPQPKTMGERAGAWLGSMGIDGGIFGGGGSGSSPSGDIA